MTTVICTDANDAPLLTYGSSYTVARFPSPEHVTLNEVPDVWYRRERFRRIHSNPDVIYVGRGSWANSVIWKGEPL